MTQHFLVIANGRTGSSWLMTCFDRFPDVRARGELKLRTQSVQDRETNHYIEPKMRSFAEAIDMACVDPNAFPAKFFGSKLIFEPYEFSGPAVFERMRDLSGSHTKIIILKRNYLDCWLSWNARGVYHDIDQDVMRRVGGGYIQIEKPETRDIVLHHQGRPLAAFDGDPINFPLITAIDNLLMFFNNDIHSLSLAYGTGLIIDYQDIPEKLPLMAQYLTSSITRDILVDIANSPLTRKLPGLRGRLHPVDTLSRFSTLLDNAFWKIAPGSNTYSHDHWRWREDGSFDVKIDGFANALIDCEVDFSFENGWVNWRPGKPITVI